MRVALEQFRAVMPRCPVLRITNLLPHLHETLDEFSINTPWRVAAFLAQIAHESAECRHFEELANGMNYEGRVDLGNVQPGDGPRYKGRGAIQLTGRANYRSVGKSLGVDLEGEPRRASDADLAFRTAGFYWHSRGLNELADRGDFDLITRRINGGMNHWRQRVAYYARALAAFDT